MKLRNNNPKVKKTKTLMATFFYNEMNKKKKGEKKFWCLF